uniref:HAT C-terminal dimerisation domain-containing protein n=1 Tax=Latimeria chalumnae TaxID=7897 RepID=H3A603_LATCH
IQNEIIAAMGHQIQQQIVADVLRAEFFAVLTDKTTNISRKEQLNISVHYVREDTIVEDFLTYINVKDITGSSLASVILQELAKLGLNLHPLAMYTHCCNHIWNLMIRLSTTLLAQCRKIACFFSRSAQLSNILCKTIKKVTPAAVHSRLKPMCETQWVERHDGVVVFVELFPAVTDALEEIQSMPHKEAALKVQTFYTISNIQFIVTMIVMESISSVVLPLSKVLQKTNLNIFAPNQLVNEVLHMFRSIFTKAVSICEELNIPIMTPRQAGIQRHCSNSSTEDSEDFYRQSIFVPYLDFVIAELTNRFADLCESCRKLWCLLPKHLADSSDESIMELVQVHQSDVAQPAVVAAEVDRWCLKWANIPIEEMLPNVIETLVHCNATMYPNISHLLRIMATLPVLTAMPERSFNTLQQIKSYTRSTMGENWLTG